MKYYIVGILNLIFKMKFQDVKVNFGFWGEGHLAIATWI